MEITKEELKKDLKTFYIDNCNLLPEGKPPDNWLENEGYQMLEKAGLKGGFRTLNRLAKLCGNDKKCMVGLLDVLITLPFTKKMYEREQRNKKDTKSEKQDMKRQIEKRIKQSIKAVELFYPGIERNELEKKAYEKIKTNLEIRKLSKPVESVPLEAHIYHHQIIAGMYLICKQRSSAKFADIALLLNFFNIKKYYKGNDYTGNDIKRIVKDYPPEEPSI